MIIIKKSLKLAKFIAVKCFKYLTLTVIYCLELILSLPKLAKTNQQKLINGLIILLAITGLFCLPNDRPIDLEPTGMEMLRNIAYGLVLILVSYKLYRYNGLRLARISKK